MNTRNARSVIAQLETYQFRRRLTDREIGALVAIPRATWTRFRNGQLQPGELNLRRLIDTIDRVGYTEPVAPSG